MLQKRVQSLKDVDYSDMRMPMVVAYNSPKDFPGKVIARVFEGAAGKPTDTYCQYDTADECRKDIKDSGFTIKFPRSKSDDPCIMESYMR